MHCFTAWVTRIAVLAIAFICAACGARPPEAPNIVKSSVILTRPGLGRVCGGVAIAERMIITAAHCVDDVSRIGYVDLSDFSNYARKFQWATVLVRDPAADVALLEPDLPLATWVTIRPPVDYEELRIVLDFEIHRPPASYVSDIRMGIFKGDSGSGVFGKDGSVVGIVVTCESPDGFHCGGVRGRYSPIRAEWLRP